MFSCGACGARPYEEIDGYASTVALYANAAGQCNFEPVLRDKIKEIDEYFSYEYPYLWRRLKAKHHYDGQSFRNSGRDICAVLYCTSTASVQRNSEEMRNSEATKRLNPSIGNEIERLKGEIPENHLTLTKALECFMSKRSCDPVGLRREPTRGDSHKQHY